MDMFYCYVILLKMYAHDYVMLMDVYVCHLSLDTCLTSHIWTFVLKMTLYDIAHVVLVLTPCDDRRRR